MVSSEKIQLNKIEQTSITGLSKAFNRQKDVKLSLTGVCSDQHFPGLFARRTPFLVLQDSRALENSLGNTDTVASSTQLRGQSNGVPSLSSNTGHMGNPHFPRSLSSGHILCVGKTVAVMAALTAARL